MPATPLVNVWLQCPNKSLPPHLANFVQLLLLELPEVSFYEDLRNQERPNQVAAHAVEFLYLPRLLKQIKEELKRAGANKAVMKRFEKIEAKIDPPGKPLPGGFGQIGRYRTGTIIWRPQTVQVEGQPVPYDLIGTVPPGAPIGEYATSAAQLPWVTAWRVGDLGAPFNSVQSWVSGMREAEKLLASSDFEEYLQKDYWNFRGAMIHAYPKRPPDVCFPRVLSRLTEANHKEVSPGERTSMLTDVRWLYGLWRRWHAAEANPHYGARNKARWDFAALVRARSLGRVPGQNATEQAFQGLIHELRTQRRRWRLTRWVERLRPAEEAEALWASRAFDLEPDVMAIDDSIYLLTHIPMPGPNCGPVWFDLVERYPEIANL